MSIVNNVRVWTDAGGKRWLDSAGTVPVVICENCRGIHPTQKCPIPEGYDPADWRKDSKGSSGCGCKE